MQPSEILSTLTQSQCEEFNNDIQQLILQVGASYDFASDKLAEVNTNLRLTNEVFLNATILFHVDDKRIVTGEVVDLIKFNNVDEYLDAINESTNTTNGFTKIK